MLSDTALPRGSLSASRADASTEGHRRKATLKARDLEYKPREQRSQEPAIRVRHVIKADVDRETLSV